MPLPISLNICLDPGSIENKRCTLIWAESTSWFEFPLSLQKRQLSVSFCKRQTERRKVWVWAVLFSPLAMLLNSFHNRVCDGVWSPWLYCSFSFIRCLWFVMPLLPDCFEKTISEHKILLSVLPLNSASSSSGSQPDLQMSVMKCTEDGAGIFCGLLSGLFV